MKFIAWLGPGDMPEDFRTIEAGNRSNAAERFALGTEHVLDVWHDGDRFPVLVSVVEADRPHRHPARYDVTLWGVPKADPDYEDDYDVVADAERAADETRQLWEARR